MLKTRILTALVLGPTILAVVFFTPPWFFRLATALLLLTGCWEFRRLANLKAPIDWILMGLQTLMIALMYINWDLFSRQPAAILSAACLAWGVMFLRLRHFADGQDAGPRYQAASFISALAVLSFSWFALAWLRDQPSGEFLILQLFFIIWAADIGAYFSGRQFGKSKLAPSISPKKTWEGVVGGILLSGIVAILLSRLTPLSETPWVLILALTAVTVMTSIGGDLFISLHKRTVNMKDAGKIFPGHGGVLDRFDSLLPGASFFALGVWVLIR